MSESTGLIELYRGEDPVVDIVAVHGLNGHPLRTWTTKSGKCWMKEPDMLPAHLKQSRVLTYGYNADVLSVLGKASDDRILEHAHTLVAELVADRQLDKAARRPLIFICHSLGGIIVKRAIVLSHSRTARSIETMHSIFVSTCGILFFGTPHDGSDKSATPPGELLDALKPGSQVLKDITDMFAPLMKRFRIFFFWEQEKTNLGATTDYIVTESSAAPILDGTERCGLAYDHRHMCRFESRTSPGYKVVVAALMRYSEDAGAIIAQRWLNNDATLSSVRAGEAAELFQTTDPRPFVDAGEKSH